ncbi:hypothetical protein Clacol_000368 [Clathrus columnatus]|uniref:Uncharacterized protein n=1 Tax=Clathrus columnatus TaxID=1419009 RepID=A0AAV4ZWH7_9AGAM|nr:hypothetical protein Clacol_000368 [Clathrus columnatus]
MSSPIEHTIPDFWTHCPFPIKLHSNSAAVTSKSQQWFDSSCAEIAKSPSYVAIFQEIDNSGVGQMVSYCFPDATEERLRILCDLGFILFLLDDLGEGMTKTEWEKVRVTVEDVLRNGKTGVEGDIERVIAKLFEDWWKRLIPSLSVSYQARLIKTFSEYLEGIGLEADHRHSEHIHSSHEEYIAHCRSTTLAHPFLEMIEYTAGIELSDEVHAHSEFLRIRNAISDYICLTNDIFSYKKEWADENNHNMVIILCKKHEKELQHAIDHVGEMAKKEIDTYLDAKAKLPFQSEEITAYYGVLESAVSGSLEWSVHESVSRYFGNEGGNVKETKKATMPHRRPSSPHEDDRSSLRRSSSDSRPHRFLAKLKHPGSNLISSNTSALPAPAQEIPANPSPSSSAANPSSTPKQTPLPTSAQMHRLGTPLLPQIQVQSSHNPPATNMSNPTAASASSISLASTLAGGTMLLNPSTGTLPSGGGNVPLLIGADRDPWHMLHFHILPLFNGEALRVPIEDLNELVRKHISNVVAHAPARAVTSLEQDVSSLLARGMVTINVRLAEVDDVKLLPRLVDVWLLFWHRVLPYVEGIFLPFKTEKYMQSLMKIPKSNRPPSPTMQNSLSDETASTAPYTHSYPIDVRSMSLCSFRDSIVYPLYSRLLGLLNAGPGQGQAKDRDKEKEREKEKEKDRDKDMVYRRIQQMLLILLSVSQPLLTSSQSQSSLFSKTPVPASPGVTSPLSPPVTTPSGVNNATSFNPSGPSNSGASMGGNTALGLTTTPTSMTTPTATSGAFTSTPDNVLSQLLNALRNPLSNGTPTASNVQLNRDGQSRASQPFHMSRHSSFLSGSAPRDRRGRIATRKTNEGKLSSLELRTKTKSPLTPSSASARPQSDEWDDETPRNARFKHDKSMDNTPRDGTHGTRTRSRSDGMLDDHIHSTGSPEDSHQEDSHGSYDSHSLHNINSSRTPVPGTGTGVGQSGWSPPKRSRRASASEVYDGHSNGNSTHQGNGNAEELKAHAQMQNMVERMVGLR